MGEYSQAAFREGVLYSFLMILMAEIGDKTFLMVMLLASKSYNKCVLWALAVLAETMMNMDGTQSTRKHGNPLASGINATIQQHHGVQPPAQGDDQYADFGSLLMKFIQRNEQGRDRARQQFV